MKVVLLTEDDIRVLLEKSTRKAIQDYLNEKSECESKNEFLTIEEVSKLLHVTNQTVRNYIKKGDFQAKKIKRRVLVSRSSIDRFLSEIKSKSYKR